MTTGIVEESAIQFDQAKAEAFADRMVNLLNESALSLMVSIGHQTGLFDVMADLPPSTSHEIAQAANLNERYVREWLGAMTTGNVVECHADGTYSLPQERAAFLTRAATPDNIAVFAQYIPLLGSVEQEIIGCFQNGGGIAYDRFPRFHEVMAEDSGQTVLSSLFSHILPLADGVTEKLERGARVLDAGCGRGRAIIMMAERFPRSQFFGYDLSEEAIAAANAEAANKGVSNVLFLARDLSDFDAEDHGDQKFDLITTFDAVHDQAKPEALLAGIANALADDGVYLMQDIHSSSHVHGDLDHPIGPLLYTISCMHCMTVSLAQGGEGLGAMWGQEKALSLLKGAGFNDVTIHQLDHDFQNDYFVARKGRR